MHRVVDPRIGFELPQQAVPGRGEIETLLERIVEADNASVIRAYEGKIAKLEREKLLLTEKAARIVPPKGRLEEFIEPALEFLGNPWNLYENGSLAFKRTVLRLAFAEPLRYSRESGYRTANSAFPFKVLAEISTSKGEMVEGTGRESNVLRFPLLNGLRFVMHRNLAGPLPVSSQLLLKGL